MIVRFFYWIVSFLLIGIVFGLVRFSILVFCILFGVEWRVSKEDGGNVEYEGGGGSGRGSGFCR